MIVDETSRKSVKSYSSTEQDFVSQQAIHRIGVLVLINRLASHIRRSRLSKDIATTALALPSSAQGSVREMSSFIACQTKQTGLSST